MARFYLNYSDGQTDRWSDIRGFEIIELIHYYN